MKPAEIVIGSNGLQPGARRWSVLASVFAVVATALFAIDLKEIPPDLTLPAPMEGEASPGRRMFQLLPAYAGTAVRHSLYLPTDWKPGRKFPVIVCNVVGLHDDAIASLWRGMICHSHYDDGRWKGTNREGARQRLQRLARIPQLVTNELPVVEKEKIEAYLASVCPDGEFTFLTLPIVEHAETWVLRDIPARRWPASGCSACSRPNRPWAVLR